MQTRVVSFACLARYHIIYADLYTWGSLFVQVHMTYFLLRGKSICLGKQSPLKSVKIYHIKVNFPALIISLVVFCITSPRQSKFAIYLQCLLHIQGRPP